MENEKVIFVTGGTGNQGGAIARNLILDKNWRVKVLTRNPNSEKSKSLENLGIELLKGDLNDQNSYKGYLKGVHGIFSVQDFKNGIDQEIIQGKQLADSAKLYDIKHLVYSSVSGADEKTGIPHFESKNKIEEHIKNIGIPYSIIRPTFFYENLQNPEVKKRILKGKLVMPLNKNLRQEFISVQDIGIVGNQIFNNRSKYLGKTITLASDSMTMSELSELLSKSMKRKIKYEKLPSIISRLVMGKNLYKMFRWIDKNEPKFVEDISKVKKEFEGMTNMKTWIEQEFK